VKNKQSLAIGLISGIVITLAVVVGLDNVDKLGFISNASISPSSKTARNKIKEIEELIDYRFLHDVEESNLLESMYAGLVAGLEDEYSHYFTKAELEAAMEVLSGHYQGIGAIMTMAKDNPDIIIGHLYEEGPAKKAGVKVGDVIIAVDGVELTEHNLEDVVNLIRYNEDSHVTLSLRREGNDELIDITIEKGDVEVDSLAAEMLQDNIGFITIFQFTKSTATQFEEVYQELREQGMTRLLVDVRGNPGGSLNGVCDTLRVFMPAGLLVYAEDKQGNQTKFESKGETPIDMPLVVLIDEHSASASEIFAGAVKEHQVGTLVGQTTFGKGVVQSIFDLSDGSGVKLTTSAYFTPNGEDINGKGITPDILVEQVIIEDEPEGEFEDVQLDKAMEVLMSMSFN